jgi:DNA-binding IclR family transcriptional regulator
VHAVRVQRVLAHVARDGCTPAEAARALGVARSSVKHHADRLRAWGLLEVRPEGGRLRLHAAPAALRPLQAALLAPPAASLLPPDVLASPRG